MCRLGVKFCGGAILNICFWQIRMYFKPFTISSQHETGYRIFSEVLGTVDQHELRMSCLNHYLLPSVNNPVSQFIIVFLYTWPF